MKQTPLKRRQGLRRTELKRNRLGSVKRTRRAISPASTAQRSKVKGRACIACGAEASDMVAIDPAHVCPRSLGGCDAPECVVPLCRTFTGGCHRLYDEHALDLLPFLEPHLRDEQAHAVMHLGIGRAYRQTTKEAG